MSIYGFDVNGEIIDISYKRKPIILTATSVALTDKKDTPLIWIKSIHLVTRYVLGLDDLSLLSISELYSYIKHRTMNENVIDKLVFYKDDIGLVHLRDVMIYNGYNALLSNGSIVDLEFADIFMKGDKEIGIFI